MSERSRTTISIDEETAETLRDRKPKGLTWGRWLLEVTGGVPDDWE